MKVPFRHVAGQIELTMDPWEADALLVVPELLESVGEAGADPAADRLDQAPYPDDPEAAAEFRRLMASEMAQSRAADRSAFSLTVEQAPQGVSLSPGEAEAWLRVLAEARLVLASRVGIIEDGWEDDLSESDPPVALLHYLGWLQQSLAETLAGHLT
jgi:hypothetical protein